jgi:death-on-curing family protein
MVKYPKPEDIVRYNKKVLEIVRDTKADRHEVKNYSGISHAVKGSRYAKGDINYKAAVLMKNLNQNHPFASGNKRTAYFSANKMIGMNKGYMLAKRRARQHDMAKRIREGRVNAKEIAKWLKE